MSYESGLLISRLKTPNLKTKFSDGPSKTECFAWALPIAMLKMPISDVIEKIKADTGLSQQEVQNKIQNKLQVLDGLISEEGAAYIVASELGVHLFKQQVSRGAIKIKDVLVGMKSVETQGKIRRVFPTKKFTSREGEAREMGSFILADETGDVRVTLWDTRVDWLKDGKLSEGTIIKIKDAYAKENLRGRAEIHLGNRSSLVINPLGVSIDLEVQEVPRKKISELAPEDYVSVLATVVQVFPPRFYPVCPKCGKKTVEGVEGTICAEHKAVQAEQAMIVNFILDDSTETIRAVAFRERASILASLTSQEAQEILQKDGQPALQEKLEQALLGRTIEVQGRVVNNVAFERTEFQVQKVNINPNPKILAEKLLKE